MRATTRTAGYHFDYENALPGCEFCAGKFLVLTDSPARKSTACGRLMKRARSVKWPLVQG
jgi:hypothetical protein